jgi:hypothetical protein
LVNTAWTWGRQESDEVIEPMRVDWFGPIYGDGPFPGPEVVRSNFELVVRGPRDLVPPTFELINGSNHRGFVTTAA